MLHRLLMVNDWLSKRMFLIVLTGLLSGLWIQIPNPRSLSGLAVVLFAYMTFVTALSTSLKKFLQVAKNPGIPLWILFLVHFVTPIFAWCLGLIFHPFEPDIRLGYLIGASVPIGVTSIIWTSIVKGNVSISLVSVTLDTFFAPLFLPFYFTWIAGHSIPINYLAMMQELFLMITLPSLIGMLFYDISKGKWTPVINSLGGITSKIAFFFVIFINASIVMPEILWNLSILKVLLLTLTLSASGYLLGYLGALPLKDSSREAVLTMVYNVGLRNIAFGVVVALTYFPPGTAIPVTLAMLFQQPLAALIPHVKKKR